MIEAALAGEATLEASASLAAPVAGRVASVER